MSQYRKWELEDLKEGLDRFYLENGRMPTVDEVDLANYLPSARWIQKKFGGLIKVRSSLGYKDTNLGAGTFRSKIAKEVNASGLKFEQLIEQVLVDKFGEPFVHVQRRIGSQKYRLDFLVYSANKNFGVDVISTRGPLRSLKTGINIKISKYKELPFELIVVVETAHSQEEINNWLKNKTEPLPPLWKVLTYKNFIDYIELFKPHTILK